MSLVPFMTATIKGQRLQSTTDELLTRPMTEVGSEALVRTSAYELKSVLTA